MVAMNDRGRPRDDVPPLSEVTFTRVEIAGYSNPVLVPNSWSKSTGREGTSWFSPESQQSMMHLMILTGPREPALVPGMGPKAMLEAGGQLINDSGLTPDPTSIMTGHSYYWLGQTRDGRFVYEVGALVSSQQRVLFLKILHANGDSIPDNVRQLFAHIIGSFLSGESSLA